MSSSLVPSARGSDRNSPRSPHVGRALAQLPCYRSVSDCERTICSDNRNCLTGRRPPRQDSLLLNVSLQVLWTDLCPINDALRIGSDALRRACAGEIGICIRVRDEGRN